MKKGALVLVWMLAAGCGSGQDPAKCSLQILVDGQPPVMAQCGAGASAWIAGPAFFVDNTVNVVGDQSAGWLVATIHLTIPTAPAPGTYDMNRVKKFAGNLENRAHQAWVLRDTVPDPFEVVVTSMEELGPEDDFKGGAVMGYRIHGTARWTLSPGSVSGGTGLATVTASF